MCAARTHYSLEIPESERPTRERERDEVFPWLLEPTGPAKTAVPDGLMSLLAGLHGALVFDRRTRVLSERLARLLPANAKVLDVGCGDGLIDHLIGQSRPDVAISGVDLIVRPQTQIPVTAFNGVDFPFEDGSFDVVMFVDVLHHTDDPEVLLREARRVARQAVVLKDHTRDGIFAGPTLRFMDWVGNAPHGIPLPYNYWPERRWREAFARLRLKPAIWLDKLELYTPPATWLFDRSLHFITRLNIT
jgi:SAM-dependent methyltransferase